MIGMGVAELILLAMMAGGGLPQQVAFGNPMIWLAQSAVTRSLASGAGLWLLTVESGPPRMPSPPVPLPTPSATP